MKNILLITAIAFSMAACGNQSAQKTTDNEAVHEHEHAHDCTGHNHEGHAHNHAITIVGIAQEGDSQSGKITINEIHKGEAQTYDYSASNPDKIAAWIPGDTVTIFIDHHHHGDHHHDSITAIKIGNLGCSHDHDHQH